jgi:hypothetical protein
VLKAVPCTMDDQSNEMSMQTNLTTYICWSQVLAVKPSRDTTPRFGVSLLHKLYHISTLRMSASVHLLNFCLWIKLPSS